MILSPYYKTFKYTESWAPGQRRVKRVSGVGPERWMFLFPKRPPQYRHANRNHYLPTCNLYDLHNQSKVESGRNLRLLKGLSRKKDQACTRNDSLILLREVATQREGTPARGTHSPLYNLVPFCQMPAIKQCIITGKLSSRYSR